jgi:hypothetical protein
MEDRIGVTVDHHRRVGTEILQSDPAVGEWFDPELITRHRLIAGDHAAGKITLRTTTELQRPRRVIERRALGGIGDVDVERHE